MKRSLEKTRSAIVWNLIPCNPAAVDMGTSWGSPPANWETTTQVCFSCRAFFQVTASEKQYWYETLRIPFCVEIVYCPACRKRSRAQRRIANRLAELAPLIESGEADEEMLREFVLVIAEGTVRRARSRNGTENWVLPGTPILLKVCEVINRLMKATRPQADLLPILLHFHQRLKTVSELSASPPRSSAVDRSAQSWPRPWKPSKAG